MFFKLNHLLTTLENYIFPSSCAVCRQPGKALCPACRVRIPRLSAVCPGCACKNALGLFCADCQKTQNYSFDGLFSYGAYENKILKSALRALKYQGAREIGLILGKMLGRQLAGSWTKAPVSWLKQKPIIMPMPLHSRRQRERGFNQSLYIAQGISALSGWPIDQKMRRLTYQAPSAKLNYHDRQKQNKIFSYPDQLPPNQVIIIVDDIITTGATAQAAANALKEAGAKIVIVATVAKSL